MAEADDSGDYQKKPKAKFKYKKEFRIRDGKKYWFNVATPIKQPEPYIGEGGVLITGKHKPDSTRTKRVSKKPSRTKSKYAHGGIASGMRRFNRGGKV